MVDATHLALALRHRELQAAAVLAVLAERQTRKDLVDAVFPGDTRTHGMNRHDFGDGYKLEVEIRPEAKADPDQLKAALQLMRESGDLGVELAERLVKWTPEVRLGEFRQLPDDIAETIKGVITVPEAKDVASPSVKLKGPA